MKLLNIYRLSILFIFILNINLYSQEPDYKWKKISGKWEIHNESNDNYLLEERCRSRNYNYSELINFNSIISLNPITNIKSFQFKFQTSELIEKPLELMFFFSAVDYYRNFYAFKFIIPKEKKGELQFISSTINDKSLEPKIKNNFTITVIKSADFKFEFNKKYNAEIKINERKAALYIDGNLLLEAEASKEINSGHIGFSSRNAKFRIEDVKVFDGDKIVFEDNFSEDLIKRATATAKRVDKDE